MQMRMRMRIDSTSSAASAGAIVAVGPLSPPLVPSGSAASIARQAPSTREQHLAAGEQIGTYRHEGEVRGDTIAAVGSLGAGSSSSSLMLLSGQSISRGIAAGAGTVGSASGPVALPPPSGTAEYGTPSSNSGAGRLRHKRILSTARLARRSHTRLGSGRATGGIAERHGDAAELRSRDVRGAPTASL